MITRSPIPCAVSMSDFKSSGVPKRDEAAKKLDELDMEGFEKTVDALRGAAEKIGSVDADELNDAVAALKAAAEKLSDIDMTSLNSLVEALDGTATKLGSAVNAIGGIFGR